MTDQALVSWCAAIGEGEGEGGGAVWARDVAQPVAVLFDNSYLFVISVVASSLALFPLSLSHV